MNLVGIKIKGSKCPTCGENESQGMLPSFQKNGSIIYELDECKMCEDKWIEEWV